MNYFYSVRSNTCVIMLLSNVFMFYQVMHIWTYCSESFVNKRFEKWNLRSKCQVLEQKHWELSLVINGSEYISVFPLIFQFSLNVPCSNKSANKLATAACKEPISTAICVCVKRKKLCNCHSRCFFFLLATFSGQTGKSYFQSFVQFLLWACVTRIAVNNMICRVLSTHVL